MKKTISLLPAGFCLVSCTLLLGALCENSFGQRLRPVTGAEIVIDPDITYQTMKGFAASDCWSPNFVGKYWNEPEKEQIARWLFSKEFDDDGNPRGIGLSMWRVNLGAGSEEQGDSGGIGSGGDYKNSRTTRRAESFLDNDTGGYNWEQQAGQQYFLRKAKDYGVESFVAFSNSPPVRYTRNGKAYATGDKKANLKSDSFDDFAVYMAEVVKHFRDTDGIIFDYISPVNEPQYKWDGNGQEGSPWTNGEIKKLIVELDKAITERNLATKIMITEAAKWWYLYRSGVENGYDNQIAEFFNPSGANYVGDISSVARLIAGHSYYTYANNAALREMRENVKTKADEFGLEVFQTEWSLLDDSGEGIPSPDNAGYIDVALFMAKMIYGDVTIAGASSWSFWTAVDVERWGHKDRFLLIALAPGVKEFEKGTIDTYPIAVSGAVKDYPTLWAMGNYSLFVRPGFKRIHIEGVDDLNGLMGTAYISPDESRIVAVYVNLGTGSVELQAAFKNKAPPVEVRRYLTDETNNLSFMPASGQSFMIPPRSVYTVVYDF
jgi:O-glycosyl hydrolase